MSEKMGEKDEMKISKEIKGRQVVFRIDISYLRRERNFRFYVRTDGKFEEALWDPEENQIVFIQCMKIEGLKIGGLKIDDPELAAKLTTLQQTFYEEREKEKKERERKEKEELDRFLSSDAPLTAPVTVAQGCDTGKFYVSMENEAVRDIVESAINRNLTGLLYRDWVPDYWLPDPDIETTVDELVKSGKAKKLDINGNPALEIDAAVVNEWIVKERRKTAEKERMEKTRKEELARKIKEEGHVVVKRWTAECDGTAVECDLDVYEVHAFRDEDAAREFAREHDEPMEFNEKLNAWLVTIRNHTW